MALAGARTSCRCFRICDWPHCCVSNPMPRIGLAGLVSPAGSWNQEQLSAAQRPGPTAGQSDEACHAAGGSWNEKFGSPAASALFISVRSSNLNG
jgi:hypothetical protein